MQASQATRHNSPNLQNHATGSKQLLTHYGENNLQNHATDSEQLAHNGEDLREISRNLQTTTQGKESISPDSLKVRCFSTGSDVKKEYTEEKSQNVMKNGSNSNQINIENYHKIKVSPLVGINSSTLQHDLSCQREDSLDRSSDQNSSAAVSSNSSSFLAKLDGNVIISSTEGKTMSNPELSKARAESRLSLHLRKQLSDNKSESTEIFLRDTCVRGATSRTRKSSPLILKDKRIIAQPD